MKYIKKFLTHNTYNTYIGSLNKLLPNVSYCEDNDEVHYNPWIEDKIIALFNITDTSSPTKIMYNSSALSLFNYIIVDGVKQDPVLTYQFNTSGTHTVKYLLVDRTKILPTTFSGCSSLVKVVIPTYVTNIGSYAFESSGLTEFVWYPESTASISPNIFVTCKNLQNVIISDNITSIGNGAFSGCSSLLSITIPNSVTSIGASAFLNSGLTSIKIDHPILFGNDIFRSCKSLVSAEIYYSLGNNMFYDCSNLENVILHEGITTIPYGCFCKCSKLTLIDIPSTVTSLGGYYQDGCFYMSGLLSVNIPNNVTSIGIYSFENCSSLTNVTVGSGITSIASRAFLNCTALQVFTITATIPPLIVYNMYDYDNENTFDSFTFSRYDNDATLKVPSASLLAYLSAWSFADTIVAI